MTWEDGRWKYDQDGAILRYAALYSREMLAFASQVRDNDQRQRLCREALECGNLKHILRYLKFAQSERSIILPITLVDADSWLLGARNAVIDLRTGEARPYEREDYITRCVAADADAAADCPRWLLFIEEIFPDPEVRHYLHKAAGYTLTGDMREQCFFFLYGTGSNGKSKFTEALEHVFGTYAARAGKGIIAAQPGSETAEGERLNESVIKDLTGGDSLRAEHKYEPSFTFLACCKLWVAGNHKPTIRGIDCGIWRRVRLAPFTQTFEGQADDRQLGEKLRAEANGILRWLLQGCLLWQQEGLTPPEAMRLAVEDYRTEEDALAAFIEDRIREVMDQAIPHAVLFQAYMDWACGNGVRYPFNARSLAKRLRERGWVFMRSSTSSCIWKGIALERQ